MKCIVPGCILKHFLRRTADSVIGKIAIARDIIGSAATLLQSVSSLELHSLEAIHLMHRDASSNLSYDEITFFRSDFELMAIRLKVRCSGYRAIYHLYAGSRGWASCKEHRTFAGKLLWRNRWSHHISLWSSSGKASRMFTFVGYTHQSLKSVNIYCDVMWCNVIPIYIIYNCTIEL